MTSRRQKLERKYFNATVQWERYCQSLEYAMKSEGDWRPILAQVQRQTDICLGLSKLVDREGAGGWQEVVTEVKQMIADGKAFDRGEAPFHEVL